MCERKSRRRPGRVSKRVVPTNYIFFLYVRNTENFPVRDSEMNALCLQRQKLIPSYYTTFLADWHHVTT
jgi:hypothetical protein